VTHTLSEFWRALQHPSEVVQDVGTQFLILLKHLTFHVSNKPGKNKRGREGEGEGGREGERERGREGGREGERSVGRGKKRR